MYFSLLISRRPQEDDLQYSESSKLLMFFFSRTFRSRPIRIPAKSPIPTEMPTQTSDHPATSLLEMKNEPVGLFWGQRVARSTEQLQYVLSTIGAITKVPKNATTQMMARPRESLMLSPFIFGYTFSQKKAQRLPAIMPMAIAAPIFMEVPATDPYIMAPVIVPSNDPRIPILLRGLMTIAVAQLAITLALRANKTEMKASCQIQLRQDSFVEARVFFRVKIVVLTVKPRKRKKVPRWARMADFSEPLKEVQWAVDGPLKSAISTSPQVAEKRYTLVIRQSSKNLLSGESVESSKHRKWLRFQQRLKRVECRTNWASDSLPNTPMITINCPIAFAKAMRRLQKSKQTKSPPRLYLQSRDGSKFVGVAPWKSVMKTLNQNFCRMGERMAVQETMKSAVNRAEAVPFLKQVRISPKPSTTKMVETMQRSPSRVWVLGMGAVLMPEVGNPAVAALRISPPKPQIQNVPKRAMRTSAPVAWLALLGLTTVQLVVGGIFPLILSVL